MKVNLNLASLALLALLLSVTFILTKLLQFFFPSMDFWSAFTLSLTISCQTSNALHKVFNWDNDSLVQSMNNTSTTGSVDKGGNQVGKATQRQDKKHEKKKRR